MSIRNSHEILAICGTVLTFLWSANLVSATKNFKHPLDENTSGNFPHKRAFKPLPQGPENDDTETSSVSSEPLTEEEESEDSSLSGLTDALSSVEENKTSSSSSSDKDENSVPPSPSVEISSLNAEGTISE